MARIMVHSNAPWCASGYGKLTRYLVNGLMKRGHKMAISAFFGLQGGIINAEGVDIYPCGIEGWGNDVIEAHAKKFGADMVITIIDNWVLKDFGKKLPDKWFPWFPVDSHPASPQILANLGGSVKSIVMSKFGLETISKEAKFPNLIYIPNSIDTKIMRPLAPTIIESKRMAKRVLGIPDDMFLVSMVAANQSNPSRKCFEENIEGYLKFHAKHPNSMLYIHTDPLPVRQGIDLYRVINILGGDNSIRFPDRYDYHLGIDEEQMNVLYNASDVLLSCSGGEGFGMPICEAQAAGTPVIVTNATGMPDLVGAGWVVPIHHKRFYNLGNWHFLPEIEKITEALENALSINKEFLGDNARKHVMQFDWDYCIDNYWMPLIEEHEKGSVDRLLKSFPVNADGNNYAGEESNMIVVPTWSCNLGNKAETKCVYCDYVPSEGGHCVNMFQGINNVKIDKHLEPKEWLDFINKRMKKPGLVEFTGGEPLMYPGFKELVNNLPDGITWAITSNTILSTEGIDPSKCRAWTASFHPTAPAPYSNLGWFIERMAALRKQGFKNIAVTVVAHPSYLDGLRDVVKALRMARLEVNVAPFYSRAFDWRKDPSNLRRLLDFSNFFHGFNRLWWDDTPSNAMCSAGVTSGIVMPDGRIYRCYSSMLWDKQLLGNATDEKSPYLENESMCGLPCMFPCDYGRRRIVSLPTVSVATLVGPDATKEHLSRFSKMIREIGYPKEKMKVVVMSHPSKTESVSELDFGGREVITIIEPVIKGTKFQRIAGWRNALKEKALESNPDYILMIDSDIVSMSPSSLSRMTSLGADVVAPLVVLENSPWGQYYDTLAFRRDGQRFGLAPPYSKGVELGSGKLLELESCGTVYLISNRAAKISNYAGDIDSEHVAFCHNVRTNGMKVMLDQKSTAFHVMLENPHMEDEWRKVA